MNTQDIVNAAKAEYLRNNKGEGHPIACTDHEIRELRARFADVFSISPCRQYIDLLRMLDGIMYDGNVIYAHKTQPLFGPGAVTSRAVGFPQIDGIVELNSFWRERFIVPREAIVYGGNEIYHFVGFGENRFCLVAAESVPGEDLVCHVDREFGSFDLMLQHVYRHLLRRARESGVIEREELR